MPPDLASRRHFYFSMADAPLPPERWLKLRSEPLAAAHAWIGLYQRFWESRIDELERYLADRTPDVD